MKIAMMVAAQRHGEFVADLAPERTDVLTNGACRKRDYGFENFRSRVTEWLLGRAAKPRSELRKALM
jgi:hypothetical protein